MFESEDPHLRLKIGKSVGGGFFFFGTTEEALADEWIAERKVDKCYDSVLPEYDKIVVVEVVPQGNELRPEKAKEHVFLESELKGEKLEPLSDINKDSTEELAMAIIEQAASDYLEGKLFYFRNGIDPVPEITNKRVLKNYLNASRKGEGQQYLDKYVKNFFSNMLKVNMNMNMAEAFFRGSWFETLTDLDAEWLINKLDILVQKKKVRKNG